MHLLHTTNHSLSLACHMICYTNNNAMYLASLIMNTFAFSATLSFCSYPHSLSSLPDHVLVDATVYSIPHSSIPPLHIQ